MKIPHRALVAVANAERFLLLRNIGQPFEPKLEAVSDLDLELTNFSAGVRNQDSATQRGGNAAIDELAHGAAIADWLNTQALRGGIDKIVIVADPRTLGEIRHHVHKELQSRIAGEVAKDLTNVPLPEIEQVLAAA
ncbi:baeRF12 domain-containing protein [Tsuneonella sp. HG222]